MQRKFDFFNALANAKPHEEGAAAEVEWKWQGLLEWVKDDKSELAPLVEKAMTVPILRRLFPFTSHNWLCFSRCTGVSFSGDCPYFQLGPWAVASSRCLSKAVQGG
jgi:hypothetical protein